MFVCYVSLPEKGGGVIHPVNGNYMLLSPHLQTFSVVSLLILITFIDYPEGWQEKGWALSESVERRDGFSPTSLDWKSSVIPQLGYLDQLRFVQRKPLFSLEWGVRIGGSP